MPVSPPPSRWDLDTSVATPGEDLVAIGADLEPGTLLAAYRLGLFPMGVGEGGAEPMGWWSPDPRGILRPADLKVSRSLRRSRAHLEVRVDTAFAEVVSACAERARPGAWITAAIKDAYTELHRLGWAHSVEAWRGGELVGGLYGVAIGQLFAGESMFHRERDASKVALVGLVEILRAGAPEAPGGEGELDPGTWAELPHADRALIDVQWLTTHLASLGAVEIPRKEYRRLLDRAMASPSPWRTAVKG